MRIIMSMKTKSVKLMSVNNKVRKNIGQFQHGFSGISDLRLVEDCLKMTAYITESVAMNRKQHS